MKITVRFFTVVVTLLLLSLFGTIIKMLLMQKVSLYIDYVIQYGEWYPIKLSIIVYLIVAFSLFLLYRLLFYVITKNVSMGMQSLIVGIGGVLIWYVSGSIFNGIIITFRITEETILGLTPVFFIGIMLPFFYKGMTLLFDKLLTKRVCYNERIENK